MDLDDLKQWHATANHMADEARALVRAAVRVGFAHHLKDDDTFVTDADQAVEKAMRRRIETRFPDHGIIGEEYEDVRPDARFCWTIDPIDGTHSFRHGVPLYGSILALLRDDTPVIGVIDLPALEMRISAAEGIGAMLNGRPHHLGDSFDDPVEKAIIAVGERQQFVRAGRESVFDTLMTAHPHVRTYCDAFGHVLTLGGQFGAMVDFGLRIWDVAATEVIAREAGATFHRFPRVDGSNETGWHDVVFGRPSVVDWLVPQIKEWIR